MGYKMKIKKCCKNMEHLKFPINYTIHFSFIRWGFDGMYTAKYCPFCGKKIEVKE